MAGDTTTLRPKLALSTMWAQQERFTGNFTRFVEIARAAGFEAIEVSHSTDEAGLDECLACDLLPVVSLHAPTPLARTNSGRWNTSLNLAALDDAERSAAVVATLRTVDVAAGHGIRYVVVHLGHTASGGAGRAHVRLSERYRAGTGDGEEAAAIRTEARAARRLAGIKHLDAARRSLADLVHHARPRGVAIGLENRLSFTEIPTPDEAVRLLDDYAPDDAGYWHDVGHAEIWSRLGFEPHQRWFDLLSGRMIGCHLHDVAGLVDHRAPGNGTVDWAMVRAGIPAEAARTCEIDQREPEESLGRAVGLLRAVGVVAE